MIISLKIDKNFKLLISEKILSKKLYIINGPNLNLLGTREPEKYGNISLDKIKNYVEKCNNYNLDLSFFQSNIEGELIDEIHTLLMMDKEL